MDSIHSIDWLYGVWIHRLENEAMSQLVSSIDPRSAAFAENAAALSAVVEDLRAKHVRLHEGGGKKSLERHVARGKLLPRERVRRLLDPGSPFLELSALAAHGMYGEDIPSAGIITGIGRIAGRECVIVCNDATVTG